MIQTYIVKQIFYYIDAEIIVHWIKLWKSKGLEAWQHNARAIWKIWEREQTKDFKSNILLNPNDTKTYGDSSHMVEMSKLFHDLKENPEEQFISNSNVKDMRNYLMLVLALVNCLRTSRLINIT